ncbi:MarR family winged helix-turn-helix transcriptional regulator [Pseudoneobacillus sp. C159]
MNHEFQHLDLLDLLSERHFQLRNRIEKRWNETHDLYISNSEWFIMARIYQKQPTIAYVSKNVNISRQATHKFIKSLESKGLVEIRDAEGNKKEKSVRLSKFGEACYEENQALKAKLEEKIAKQIGSEKVLLLKEILKIDWGLSQD